MPEMKGELTHYVGEWDKTLKADYPENKDGSIEPRQTPKSNEERGKKRRMTRRMSEMMM